MDMDLYHLFMEHEHRHRQTLLAFMGTEACDEFIINIGKGYYGAYVDSFNDGTGILYISDSGFSDVYIQQLSA
jgi:hypothetical protein|nr:MAG TPA: hypothetical protein [Caudoviricetes sp.]